MSGTHIDESRRALKGAAGGGSPGLASRVTIGAATDHPEDLADTCYRIFQIITSLNALLHSLELLPFLNRIHQPFGVLVICIEQMMADLERFFEIYLIAFLAFSISMIGFGNVRTSVSNPNPHGIAAVLRVLIRARGQVDAHSYNESYFTYNGVFTIVAWSTFGWIEPNRFDNPVAILTLWLYVLFVNVTLVNLLIAMFSDTYGRVSVNARKEYAFKRYMSLHIYQNIMVTTPPPLNAPYIIWLGVRRLCGYRGRETRTNVASPSARVGVGPQAEALARASLNRQVTKDMATLGALADALPAHVEGLDERLEVREILTPRNGRCTRAEVYACVECDAILALSPSEWFACTRNLESRYLRTLCIHAPQ